MLFLHGYLADKRSFSYQLNFFARDFDVYALDFKGFGENSGMDYPYSLKDYVKDLNQYVEKNCLYGASVIAHSFGARVAIKAVAENPNLFSKMVLTGAAGLKPRYSIKKVVKKSAFKVLKKFIKKEKLKKFYSPDYLALSPVMRESFKLIVGENLDGLLCKIETPTLIVFGENDKETPLYMARRLNKGIKNSQLMIIKGAGHFCFIDKSVKFNTEVKEFLLS